MTEQIFSEIHLGGDMSVVLGCDEVVFSFRSFKI